MYYNLKWTTKNSHRAVVSRYAIFRTESAVQSSPRQAHNSDTLGKYSIPLVCALLGQHEFRKGESELGHSIVFFTNSYIASLVLILLLGRKVK